MFHPESKSTSLTCRIHKKSVSKQARKQQILFMVAAIEAWQKELNSHSADALQKIESRADNGL